MSRLEQKDIQDQLHALGIHPDHIRALHVQLKKGALDRSTFVIPKERLRAPTTKDLIWPDQLNRAQLEEIGNTILKNDQLLVFWLSGGAATRYFDQSKITPDESARYGKTLQKMMEKFTNLPKGVSPVIADKSYLELKVLNLLLITKRLQLPVHPHVIIMTSFITDEHIRTHVETLFTKYADLDPSRFHFIVQQPRIPRFTKVDELKNIDVFVNSQQQLSFAPCGHGDFVELLQEYLRTIHLPNLQYMFFANVDNIAATIEPWLLGLHAQNNVGRMVELVEKDKDDQGGAPCFVDGELVILEQMKFPNDFDQNQIRWFNTNNFWFSLQELLSFHQELPFVLAEKTIAEGEVIQLERFACDVHLPSQYVVLPRLQRFWPVKRYVDLLIYQDPTYAPDLHHAFKNLLKTAYDI